MDVQTISSDGQAELGLFERAPDPFVITDLSGSILALNGAARTLHPDAAVGIAVETLFVTGDRVQLLLALRSLAQGTADHCDLRVELAVGEQRVAVWVRAARTCWGAPPEPVVHWIVRDLGPSEASLQQLARTAALKDAYLLALAHDLRTPVSSLQAVAELLRVHAADEDRVVVLSDVLSQSAREIDHTISDLLDVERLEHDGLKVTRRSTSLRDLLERCVEASGAEGAVELDVPDAMVSVDKALCARILVNVLANARQHGARDGIVRVRARTDDQGVTITVDDNGPGIPGEAKEAVFDLFHQVGGGAGVGVGLYLVRRFALLHGGWATIRDAPGGGTSVEVRLST